MRPSRVFSRAALVLPLAGGLVQSLASSSSVSAIQETFCSSIQSWFLWCGGHFLSAILTKLYLFVDRFRLPTTTVTVPPTLSLIMTV